MYIWKIEQSQNSGYDTYSDAIVVAETEEAARCIHPHSVSLEQAIVWDPKYVDPDCDADDERPLGGWLDPDGYNVTTYWADRPSFVTVTRVGVLDEGVDVPTGVLCASFHAG